MAIDPYFPIFQDWLIATFPNSHWIIIDTPIDKHELNGSKIDPAFVKEKLEYLTGKVKANRFYYDDLLLGELTMGAISIANDDINDSQALAAQVEPLQETANNQEMQDVLKEMCKPQPEAYEVLTEMWNFALMIDHFFDGDGTRKATVLRALKSMFVRMPLNPFYMKNCAAIGLAFVPIIAAWEHSNNEGVSKVWAIQLYSSLPALFAYIIGGQSHVDYYMPKIHKLLDIGLEEDEARDLGAK